MKYKVGDRVKIREDLEPNTNYGGLIFIHDMLSIRGKYMMISSIDKSSICGIEFYSVEESDFKFTDEMIEELSNKEIKEKDMKGFKIVDYKVYDGKAVVIKFEDREGNVTEEKAVCCEEDKFDFERGLEVCVLKHIFGSEKYKSLLKESMRQIKNVDKAVEEKKKSKAIAERRRAKAIRRKARKRERRIAEMKEAYIAAIKECGVVAVKSFDDFAYIDDYK